MPPATIVYLTVYLLKVVVLEVWREKDTKLSSKEDTALPWMPEFKYSAFV